MGRASERGKFTLAVGWRRYNRGTDGNRAGIACTTGTNGSIRPMVSVEA
jgi:hypothetical protein